MWWLAYLILVSVRTGFSTQPHDLCQSFGCIEQGAAGTISTWKPARQASTLPDCPRFVCVTAWAITTSALKMSSSYTAATTPPSNSNHNSVCGTTLCKAKFSKILGQGSLWGVEPISIISSQQCQEDLSTSIYIFLAYSCIYNLINSI